MSDNERHYVTARDIAATYRVHLNTVRDWIKRGLIPAVKVRRTVRLDPVAVARALAGRGEEGQP